MKNRIGVVVPSSGRISEDVAHNPSIETLGENVFTIDPNNVKAPHELLSYAEVKVTRIGTSMRNIAGGPGTTGVNEQLGAAKSVDWFYGMIVHSLPLTLTPLTRIQIFILVHLLNLYSELFYI
ncbi:hypothetical protein C0J52_18163 [Blattella germanica]|nr:hypothetical protein C0J52_18163 [Blattella germanica]